jgi:hypothetical protein
MGKPSLFSKRERNRLDRIKQAEANKQYKIRRIAYKIFKELDLVIILNNNHEDCYTNYIEYKQIKKRYLGVT